MTQLIDIHESALIRQLQIPRYNSPLITKSETAEKDDTGGQTNFWMAVPTLDGPQEKTRVSKERKTREAQLRSGWDIRLGSPYRFAAGFFPVLHRLRITCP